MHVAQQVQHARQVAVAGVAVERRDGQTCTGAGFGVGLGGVGLGLAVEDGVWGRARVGVRGRCRVRVRGGVKVGVACRCRAAS